MGRMIKILAFMVVFWNLVITVKQFRITLQLRSIQRLAQHGSNKEEMRENKYFEYATNILCVGFLFIFLSLCLLNILKIFISSVLFSDCYFLSNLFPNIHFHKSSEGQLNIPTELIRYLIFFGHVLGLLGLFIVLVPFILVSFHNCYKLVSRAMRNNSTNYRIRGHEIY